MHGGQPEHTNTVLQCTQPRSPSPVVLRPPLSHFTLHRSHMEERSVNNPFTPAKQGYHPHPLSSRLNSRFPLSLRYFSLSPLYPEVCLSFFWCDMLSLSLPISLVTCGVLSSSCLLPFEFISYIHLILVPLLFSPFSSIPSCLALSYPPHLPFHMPSSSLRPDFNQSPPS